MTKQHHTEHQKNATKIKDKVVQRIKDETMRAKTGKAWDDWYEILDTFDVKKQGHKAAAKFLQQEHQVSAWYAQSITVGYEYARGLRW
ncbi:MAG: hypothetical protein R2880_08260 [Deinococcales bacterium]